MSALCYKNEIPATIYPERSVSARIEFLIGFLLQGSENQLKQFEL